MTLIKRREDVAQNQAVSTTPAQTVAENSIPKSSDFKDTLAALITSKSADQVSEEELFSGLVRERIQREQGEEGLEVFDGILDKHLSARTKADGYVAIEEATKSALIEYRDSGAIEEDMANTIYSQAFAAAQLDDNVEVLFDDRGGAGDPTIAVASLEQALLSARVQIEKFDSGEAIATIRTVDESTPGKSAFMTSFPAAAQSHGHGAHANQGSGGFLFKPSSDSDGKLVVLLPSVYSGMAQSMRLMTANGDVIETGRYAGNANGNREHFRFSQHGQNYPANLIVETTLSSGETISYSIANPGQRTENINPD